MTVTPDCVQKKTLYITKASFFVHKKKLQEVTSMILSGVEGVRDPFVLRDGTHYYLYGTGVYDYKREDWENTAWICYVNKSGRLDGPWKQTETIVFENPDGATKNRWAPEVHKYRDAYYMFATYYWEKTGRRGCTILKAPSPAGPFVEITKGHITPPDWDAIDGTLYIDREGQPWMFFVHEWTSTADGIGTMAVAKLSEDLTHFVTEPVELFRADAPSWSDHQVTDGCFLYTTENGTLLMLWSNFDENGYCVGIARSESGNVLGPWTQDDQRLFCRGKAGVYDGGHGMIFTDTDGQMYLTIHSPNCVTEAFAERTVFIPIKEENNTLVIV